MKAKIGTGGSASVSDAPVVRILGSGRVMPVNIQGERRSNASMHILALVRDRIRAFKSRHHGDQPYIGCLWRSDDSVALFSVDQLDKSVKLYWEHDDLLRDVSRELEDVIDQIPVSPPVAPKSAPRVVSIPDGAAIPRLDNVVRVDSEEAPQAGAELIRRMRVLRGMSRSQLAGRLNVAPSRIAELELGKGPQGPTLSMLARVAEACEINLNVALDLQSRPRK